MKPRKRGLPTASGVVIVLVWVLYLLTVIILLTRCAT